ncbi:cytosine deaminase [Paracoccus halophilus]|uniref:Cytosine deaminase n=1 Tax=Paracoccus halophilus TaxID=376733 RepID=A0A099F113_9RHOB|nr:cytosine deaminase [Paracoccus halophilus]KGJ04380.1 cytosine deaminase [Paracoccus halophilus]SFA54988.1 cytosine deaminase [Paracoccus halophilus]
MDFRVLPSGDLTLTNLTAPGCLIGREAPLETISLSIRDGRIAAPAPGLPQVDMRGAMVFPAFIDMHTHLDKGHIWPRAANPDGSFDGALRVVEADRVANWSGGDVRARMDFALRCAWAHGSRAIRTHLDSIPPQHRISFAEFTRLREEWAGRIDLQAVCLTSIDRIDPQGGGEFAEIADLTAESGGVLGCVTFPDPLLRDRLRAFFAHAGQRGLHADFHVDESGDPAAASLRAIAEVVLETGFDAPVTVGHCCSLAVQPDAEWQATLDLVARAGIHVVSLPLCNLYLQDRAPDRTPRWRGITLVHEMAARGINVSFASDNTRDPFYAYGDLDMIEVMREATRIAHLDHSRDDWIQAFLANPARACGFDAPSLMPGAPADLVICRARSWTELFARPQSDRIVLRDGHQIDRSLPDYAELDHLMS